MDLVVAAYQEDLSWLTQVPKHWNACVYSKDQEYDGAIVLPNVGREAHTHLFHIIAHYDSLPDLTAFVQGEPFEHTPKLYEILRRKKPLKLASESLNQFPQNRPIVAPHRGFIGIGKYFDGLTGFRPDIEFELGILKALRVIWEHYETRPFPKRLRSVFGLQMIMSKELIQSKSKEWHQWLLDYTQECHFAPWAMERIWFDLLGLDVAIL
jgi:hypothetical protein